MAKVTCPQCTSPVEVTREVEVAHGGFLVCNNCNEAFAVVPDKRNSINLKDNGGPWKGGWMLA